MQIHQLVPALHDGDAIGDSARAMRDYLRRQGHTSEIFAYTIDDSLSDEAIDFNLSKPQCSEKDILVYHFALPSGMTEFIKRATCRKAMIYHNITPAHYWLPYDPTLLHLAYAGRKELESLATFIERSAGDSEYNRQELQDLNFKNTCVLPIYVKQERYQVKPSQLVMDNMHDDSFNILFVGRIAPNKKLEDLMKLLFFYKKLFIQPARLVFVGKTNVVPEYYSALTTVRMSFGLLPEDVLYTGHVDWPELVAYYKSSHVFVSMSEHEGFCVPLVEAMICGTPIVAYAATAVPYTLGDAGIQFQEKNYADIAAICNRLGADSAFRETIIQNQRARLKAFSREEIEKAI
ncbi:MAG TPA: glycosyltransferase, partial [Acidobacteriota bacterium]|nr:glycosyltransferase [Acidobacteriota bacterium]